MRNTTIKPSHCPCHPEERRDERFGYLDMLIQAGWGAVPLHVIEKELQSNGGVLPPAPPPAFITPEFTMRRTAVQ